jgi:ribosomal protein L12E/L44/L45/RPP1/RPP2
VVATIGAEDLHLRARELEAAIKGGNEESYEGRIDQLELVMVPVMEGLSALAATRDGQRPTKAAVDLAVVTTWLDELAALIDGMDPDATVKAEALKDQLGSAVDRGLMDTLLSQVSGFEFDEARRTLRRLRGALAAGESAGDSLAASISPEEMSDLFEAVETLLKEMDPDAEEKAAELIGALGRRADRQSLRRLEKQVAGFEFEEALESIAQLRKTVFNKPGRGGS